MVGYSLKCWGYTATLTLLRSPDIKLKLTAEQVEGFREYATEKYREDHSGMRPAFVEFRRIEVEDEAV